MWIAKPIRSLSPQEKASWHTLEVQLPLSQTLSWAHAIEAVSGRTFLIFDADERVGGLVFTQSPRGSQTVEFECINGPHLHWDHAPTIPRQIATFAMAVSKLDPKFRSLKIKPRWEKAQVEGRIQHLPLEAFGSSSTSTLIIPIQKNEEEQMRSFNPRLKRTLLYSLKNGVTTQTDPPNSETLETFVRQMSIFAIAHHFTVPPLVWFQALINTHTSQSETQLKFWIITSTKQEKDQDAAVTQLLICKVGARAFYLFGYDRRSPQHRSAISTSAVAHWTALSLCRSEGIQTYDLNGYLPNAQPSHPYYGVSRFKEQFGGNLIHYEVPEFLIE